MCRDGGTGWRTPVLALLVVVMAYQWQTANRSYYSNGDYDTAEAIEDALAARRGFSHFSWSAVTIFAFIYYVYAAEIEKGNWSRVAAGLTFFLLDWLIEMLNALIIPVLGSAPLWYEDPTHTMLQIFVGVNLETFFMFAIAGVVVTKLFPADRSQLLLGLNNRLVICFLNSVLCVAVEMFLHHYADRALGWSYWWWSAQWPWLIIFAYFIVFHLPTVLVYDSSSPRFQWCTVLLLLAVDVGMTVYFTIIKPVI